MQRKIYWLLFAYALLGEIWIGIVQIFDVPLGVSFLFWFIMAYLTSEKIVPWIVRGVMKKIEVHIIQTKTFIPTQSKKGNSNAKQTTSDSSRKDKNISPKTKESKSSKQVKRPSSSKK